ncbi:MAG: hypothetical protein QG621_28 [Patescibacteria group bacterium]|nr:hypothetical protein [Patescibacteria group bacterium]
MAQKGNKKDSLEELKDSLYSREKPAQTNPDERSPLSPISDIRPPVAWKDTTIESRPARPIDVETLEPIAMKKKGWSFATKFFLTSLVFFLGAAGVAAYIILQGGNTISPKNIDVQVVAASVIDGGKPATFQIIIDNRNQSPLQSVDLSIDYPDGTRDPTDQTKQLTHEKITIGTIAPGQQIKRTVTAVFYGQEGSAQRLAANLSYSVPNSNSVFQKPAEASFTLGSSPVSISIQAPAEAISGEQFGVDVTVTSNTPTPIADVALQGQYPFGFSVVSTNPTADTGGTTWRLGTLQPGDAKVVHLTGRIDGQDGEERVFRFVAGPISDPTETSIKVPFIVVPQTLTVHRPFVTANIALNGKSGKTVSVVGQQTIQGTVTWQNNLSVPVSNLELRLLFSGPMIDTNSITAANGFYESRSQTIVWSRDQDSNLASIPPGGSGTEQFTFTTLAPGTGGTVYVNPTVSLSVGVSGVREGQSGVPETVSSAATIEASIASAASITAQALHFSGPFQNAGPMPPVAEKTTTYTIVWTVKNPSNTIANAVAQTTLPLYVQYVAAGQGSGITYDSGTRTVTWSLGDLKAGVGYSTAAKTAAFQVALTPSASQVGGTPVLVNATGFTGQDRFAQVGISTGAPAPTTALSGDSASYTNNMANIAPKQ